MKPLNVFQRLSLWWHRRRSRACRHHFSEDFSDQIRDGWERCSSSLTCTQCGEDFPYEFLFYKVRPLSEDQIIRKAILAAELPANPDFGTTHHVSKVTWRWGVRGLGELLPEGWVITGSTGVGWSVQYRKFPQE